MNIDLSDWLTNFCSRDKQKNWQSLFFLSNGDILPIVTHINLTCNFMPLEITLTVPFRFLFLFYLFPFFIFLLLPVFTWSSPTVSRSPRTVSSGIRFFGRLLSFVLSGRLLPVGVVGRLLPVGLVGRLISAGLDFIGLTGRLAFEVLLAGKVVSSSSLDSL